MKILLPVNPALKTTLFATVMSALITFSPALDLDAHAARNAKQLRGQVYEILDDFKREVKGSQDVLNKAYAILVFPAVYQGGYIIGGEYGEGAMMRNGQFIDYYKIYSGSVGFQLGGQKKTLLFAFMSESALADFRRTKGFEIGGEASAAVFVVGAEDSITNQTLNKPIVAFVLDQDGLMYNLSLEGSKIHRVDADDI